MDEDSQKQSASVHGDYVGRDKISASNIATGSSIVVGRGAEYTVNAAGAQELARAFSALYSDIAAFPDRAAGDRQAVIDAARLLEQELLKGSEADPGRVERWLAHLQALSPMAYERTLAVLTSPALNVALPIRTLVARLSAEAAQRSPAATRESLQAEVARAGLAPDLADLLTKALYTLEAEMDRGERGDVRHVRQALAELTGALPALRPALALWLEASPKASTPVKIMARKVLSS